MSEPSNEARDRFRAAVRRRSLARRTVRRKSDDCPAHWAACCVVLGISTGGPPALARLLAELRPPMPPLVIVQHMPPQFTGPLAARLDALSQLTVREAQHGEPLEANVALVAPGGRHLEIVRRQRAVQVRLSDGPPQSGHRPSVDVLFASAAAIFHSRCLAVIMTGMGRDGVAGCGRVRQAGGLVLAQDEATSAVYGMNRAAVREGHVDWQFALEDAAAVIARGVGEIAGREENTSSPKEPCHG